MAGRGQQTFKKRQKEQQRKEKQQEKLARKLDRPKTPGEGGPPIGDPEPPLMEPGETLESLLGTQ